jgi:diaminopimelate epimerase
MVYYNADGKPGSMCGNGGRCLVAFARFLDIVKDQASFTANGDHYKAEIEGDIISLTMRDVSDVETHDTHWFVNTGSPHHIEIVEDVDSFDVINQGTKLRHEVYGEAGSNINFVSAKSRDTFKVRTFERGVEDETQSCGTGVTAVALAMHHAGKSNSRNIKVKTLGGDLRVQFDGDASGYFNIKLKGPAVQVFKGYLEC